MEILEFIQTNRADFISFREYIHAHPELSFEEHNTSAYIRSILDKHDISFVEKAGTGIVAEIRGMEPDTRCLALRADLDALPITELNEVPYKSQNEGVMHACGHDVHSTCLLSAAITIKQFQSELKGTVRFIFQPGEEKHPGGASMMIKEGVLEGVDAIIALHVYPHLPAGTYGFRAGKYMASTDEIFITFKGKGGHAAMPHLAVDPIAMASEFIVGVQQVISRKKNPILPSVLTFGKFEAGNAPNVIPDEAHLAGTLRCLDEEWRHQAHEWIKKYATELAVAWGGSAEVEIPLGYPSLVNNYELTARAQEVAQKLVGEENVKKLDLRMTAEDFSFYTHHVPGCFFRLGTNKANKEYTTPVHNAHFDINEDAIEYGVRALVAMAFELDLDGIQMD